MERKKHTYHCDSDFHKNIIIQLWSVKDDIKEKMKCPICNEVMIYGWFTSKFYEGFIINKYDKNRIYINHNFNK